MLNSEILSSREPSGWRGKPARGWTETAASGNSARSMHCVFRDLWARGLGPVNDEGVQTAMAVSAQDSHQEGTWHLLRLQKHCTQNTWYAWRTAWSPLEDKRGGRLAAGSPLRPHLGESSGTGLFFLGNFSPSLLFFSSMLVGGGQFY